VSTSKDRGHNQSLNSTLPLCKDGQNTTLTVLLPEFFQYLSLSTIRADHARNAEQINAISYR
jgi:hypothetical protein